MPSLTEKQLDAIEAVKGKRNPALWDPRCQQYLDNQSKKQESVSKTEKG
tara:strand:+ start:812 stop:958 length:147 start_codon:yes stop_codon:yes gene_type:complete